ncbi:Chaperone protein dnaJ 49 [Bienertia sinuspersici]
MECNKDEAAKAKELAEKKFAEKDVMGARKFATKAHTLFPGLDGLQQLLATLNIYLSAERKVNGEVDWYGVLGVEPSSDDEAVKKQYRKLALSLHPDKNKSVGAEGAFKILSEAWNVLSDKARRTAFDQKRNLKSIYEKVVPAKPSRPVGSGSRPRSANNGNFNMNHNSPNPHLNSIPPPKHKTFWTMCTTCKMQFEYVLFYLNKKLECYNCKEPFLAIQIPPPHTNSHPPSDAPFPPETSSHPFAFMSSSTDKKAFQARYSGSTGSMPTAASSASRAVNGVQYQHESLKRMHEAPQVSATLEAVIKSKTNACKKPNAGEANGACSTGKGEKPRKRRRTSEIRMNDSRNGLTDSLLKNNVAPSIGNSNGFQNGVSETEKVTVFGSRLSAMSKELSLLETRNMLIAKAKTEICKKLNEWNNMGAKLKASTKQFGPNANVNGVGAFGSKSGACVGVKHPDEKLKISSPSNSISDTEDTEHVPLSMTVPDPDFHDFDKDRTEKSFGDSQVWAAYDDDDGMPRYYAMIHNVISRKPFKMRISWLNSKSTAEFSPINWVGCGFYKTSGEFRVGRHEINKSVNSFSHRVKWSKGARGAIRIYPSKGDVWALYRNWSPEWNEHTPDEEIHQYDMVEILNDYNEEKGATVIPLVKVAGFKTVFRQHVDQEQVRVIPREEMFRFSHQVPSVLLTGQESPNAPKGCWELDTAAISMELFKVMTEATEEVKKEDTVEVAKDGVSDLKESIWSNIATSEAQKLGDRVSVQVGATVGY